MTCRAVDPCYDIGHEARDIRRPGAVAGRGTEVAFRKATGVSLKVMPPGDSCSRRQIGSDDNDFCRLAASTSRGLCGVPGNGGAPPTQRGEEARAAAGIHCYAGLTVFGGILAHNHPVAGSIRYENVYVAARIPVNPGESIADALERASSLVDARLPIEVAKASAPPPAIRVPWTPGADTPA